MLGLYRTSWTLPRGLDNLCMCKVQSPTNARFMVGLCVGWTIDRTVGVLLFYLWLDLDSNVKGLARKSTKTNKQTNKREIKFLEIVHVNDVVTDWSYAFTLFLRFFVLFLAILHVATLHIANVFFSFIYGWTPVSLIPRPICL